MPLILKDRVQETTTTTGTSDIVLAGAVSGFETFLSAIEDGNTTYYTILNSNRWEVGIGTYTQSTNTLSRDTILASSSSDSKISLNGVSNAFVTYPADKSVILDADGYLTSQSFAGIKFPDGSVQTYATQHTGVGASGSLAYWDSTTGLAHDSSLSWNAAHTQLSNTKLTKLSPSTGLPLDIKRDAAGNMLQGSVNSYTKGVSLHLTTDASPTWKLGLRDLADADTVAPDQEYAYGGNSSVGMYAASDSAFILNYSNGFWVKHKGADIVNAGRTAGIVLSNQVAGSVGMQVKSAIGQSANIQQWQKNDGTVLTAIDKTGAVILNTQIAKADAPNSSFFYESASGTLAFKNSAGSTSFWGGGGGGGSAYTAGSGLNLNGDEFDAITATTSVAGITTLSNTINSDQDKALTPKAVNDAGYLTSLGTALVDADFGSNGIMTRTGAGSYSVTSDNSSNWDTAYGWGNHASEGYLTSETSHTDVVVDGDFSTNGLLKRTGAGAYTSVTDNSSNWDTAYGWGNHTSAGYLTSETFTSLVQDTSPQLGGTLDANSQSIDMGTNTITDTKVGYWDTAYGWGDHGSAGYLTSQTSHADVVIDGDFGSEGLMKRGGSAGTYSIVTDNSTNWDTAYGWGNHASAGYSSTDTTYTAGSGLELHGTTFEVGVSGANILATNSPTDNFVPSYDSATGKFTWVVNAGGGGGINNVVEDSSPQLGGDLDANGNDIDMGTNTITDTKVGQWDTAYGWGNHGSAGYLSTETFPYASGSTVSGIATTAHGWGDHASAGYAPTASPTFTGTPAAPTAAAATNTTQVATTAFVRTEVSNLVASAPATLDTLNELAAAINDDADFSTTITNSIATKIGNVVEDTSPQLGGQLDANGQSIDMGTNTITDTKVGYWDTAYGWGDHGSAGYLSTETFPYASGAIVSGIATTAHGWGNHASAGYLTSQTSHADVLVDGDFGSAGLMKTDGAGTYSIVTDSSTNWNTAYGWGDHGSAGYLTASSTNTLTNKSGNISQWTNDSSYLTSETFPYASGSVVSGIATTAHGWGNHASAGYLTSETFTSLVQDTTPQLGGTLDANSNSIDMGTNTITDTKVGQWDTAYGWGDHSGAGYQASDAGLTSIAGLTTSANKMIYTTASDTYATTDLTATAITLLDDSSTSDMRTTLGLAIGSDVQAYDADLAAIAGLTSAADKGIQFTGAGTASTYDLTAAGKALLDDADAAAQRTTLGLAIGSDVQAYDADLAAIAGLTSAADKGIQFTGAGTAATYDLTAAGKALLDDADAAAQRTTLGLGSVATKTYNATMGDNANIPDGAAIKAYGDTNWAGGTPEGTAVLSTGETGATKFLREDGDGTCSWQVPSVAASAGGSDTQIQFNDSTAIAGDADLTWNKTTNVMTINGHLAASTKSFLIDHPTKPEKKLQYACLEGPENGVYIRGYADSNIIELPEYWVELVDPDSITVQLTSKGCMQPYIYVSSVSDNKIHLISDRDISVFYTVNATRRDVAPLEVEV